MRRLLSAPVLLLACALCAACGDDRVDAIAVRAVAALQADPLVAQARYSSWHPGIDDSQEPNLILSVTAASEQVDLASFQPLIERTAAEVWRSPSSLTQLWYVISAKGFQRSSAAGTGWPAGDTVPGRKLVQLCVRLAQGPGSAAGPAEARSAPASSAPAPPEQRARWRPVVSDHSFNNCDDFENSLEQQFAERLSADLLAAYGPHKTS